MNAQWYLLWVLPVALALDLTIGDPSALPHPIRWMGRAIQLLESRSRCLSVPLKLSGAAMAVALITGTWLLSWMLLRATFGIHFWAGWCLSVVMLFYVISIRSLAACAMHVWRALTCQDLETARKRLGHIVGREVKHLNEQDVIRAAVETVAENLDDGVISPLFYALIGGPAMAMAYKMINTLDSMIGYRTEAYRQFGWLAAKIDDAANYLPARLAVPFIAAGAQLLNGRGSSSLSIARQDGRRHTSPNAGYPEAAFAGALKIQLGGPNIYHGQWVIKPFIGSGLGAARNDHIPKACDLMILTALLWSALCWVIRVTMDVLF